MLEVDMGCEIAYFSFAPYSYVTIWYPLRASTPLFFKSDVPIASWWAPNKLFPMSTA
jgi:hypothetical protein